MMNFRKIKLSITGNVLGPAEGGRYRTIGYQKQNTDVEDVLGKNRTVQVFFSSSDFPKNASGLQGPFKHEISYRIELAVAEDSAVNLAALKDENATDADREKAWKSFIEAGDAADDSFDELAEIVFQVLMDARNIDLGLPVGDVSDRWVGQIRKDEPEPTGEFVMLTGAMMLTCSTSEAANGDPGVTGAAIIDTTVDLEDDDVEKGGVKVTTTE
jgi:hypothetical protein